MEMFYYTVDAGRVAGLPGPAYMEWDFARLRKMGYSVVVSLACDHLNTFEIEDAGFEHKKICVEDFTAPTLDQVDEFVAFVDSKIAEGKKVLVHCYAGRGRTGTMLAAYLIHQGIVRIGRSPSTRAVSYCRRSLCLHCRIRCFMGNYLVCDF